MRHVNEDEELDVICLISIDPMQRSYNFAIHFDSTTKPNSVLDHLQGLINHYRDNPAQMIDDASIIEPQ